MMAHRLHLYEVIDNAPVILDIGSFYTKCGFAGEGTPRAIFPTLMQSYDGKNLPWYVYLNQSPPDLRDLADGIESLLNKVFLIHLQITPNSRDVIICENLFFPITFRQVLVYVLFERFQVPSVSFLPGQLLPLVPLKKKTGIVVDYGFSQITTLPVYEGCGLLHAAKTLHFGDSLIHESLSKSLDSRAKIVANQRRNLDHTSIDMVRKYVSDIRIRLTSVYCEKRELLQTKDLLTTAPQNSFPHPSQWKFPQESPADPLSPNRSAVSLAAEPKSPPHGAPATSRKSKEETVISFPLSLDFELQIPKVVLEDCFEQLFNDSENSICSIVLDSILKTEIDTRCELLQNIFLSGGGFCTPGMQKRFFLELVHTMATNPVYSSLSCLVYDVNLISIKPLLPSTLTWVGASIAGSLKKTQAISLKEFQTKGSFTSDELSDAHLDTIAQLFPDWVISLQKPMSIFTL
jgi:actin-related protein